MSRIYKICVVNENANKVFAIKPHSNRLDNFKNEIFIRMPKLRNYPLKIYYQNSDGENIYIYNAMDFKIFADSKIIKVFVEKNVAAVASNTLSALVHTFHPDVICDGCEKNFRGYRYKCLQCDDYDLCMECRPKLHNHHLMLCVADPSHANIWDQQLGKRALRQHRSEGPRTNSKENDGMCHKRHVSSFDSCKDKVFMRTPEWKNLPLKIHYQDADGDNINIFNASDFEIFEIAESKNSEVFVEKKFASDRAGARVFHPNVFCDGCNEEVWGHRYECLQCDDYDLCMECRPKLHNHHLMLCIADPSHANIWHQKLSTHLGNCPINGPSTNENAKPRKRRTSSTSKVSMNEIPNRVCQLLVGANNANENTNGTTNTKSSGSQRETAPANGPLQYSFAVSTDKRKLPRVPGKAPKKVRLD